MSQDQQQALEILAPDRGISASSTSNSGQITDTLKRAMQTGHLVSPSTTCPSLPIGCEVAFSSVLINPNSSEVYNVGGKLGLAKPALDKIAKAVGVSWDPIQSRRLDDGSDPFYASYRAVGMYRHFDGTIMTIIGEKQMDLHDDSETARTVKAGELSMQRKFIAEHAETKARLRAIRSMGIQTSYTAEELKKPFIVAKLMLTGRVKPEDDPTGDLQRILTHNISQSMLGGNKLLYGQDTPAEETVTPEPTQQPSGEILLAATLPAPAEEAQKRCTPDECYGKGSAHVRACSAPLVEPQGQPITSTPEPWVIPEKHGEKGGFKINDPGVTDSDLRTLVGRYDYILEEQTEGMAPEEIKKVRDYRKHVFDELERRGAGPK